MRLSDLDFQFFIQGASVFATGGGGSYTGAEKIAANMVAHQKTLQLITLDQLSENSLGVCPALIGGGLKQCLKIYTNLYFSILFA